MIAAARTRYEKRLPRSIRRRMPRFACADFFSHTKTIPGVHAGTYNFLTVHHTHKRHIVLCAFFYFYRKRRLCENTRYKWYHVFSRRVLGLRLKHRIHTALSSQLYEDCTSVCNPQLEFVFNKLAYLQCSRRPCRNNSCKSGFLRAPALKRHLEDGRGFRGRKKLLVAKVSSFP